MKKRLIISSIVIAVIIILLVLLIFIFSSGNSFEKCESNNNLNNTLMNNEIDNDMSTIDDRKEYTFEKIPNVEDYYILRSCVAKYYLITSGYFNTDDQDDRNIYIQNMYSILNSDYLKKNNISEGDIVNLMFDSDKYYINIENILFFKEPNNNIYAYLIRLNLRNIETNNISFSNMIVLQDRNTNSFSILPDEYISNLEYDSIKENNKILFKFPEKIEKNEFNMFGRYQFDMSDYANELIQQLKEFLLYNPQRAYELLDEDLKNKDFKTYEEFYRYLENNYAIIFELTSDNYMMEYKDDYMIYRFKSNKDTNFLIELVTKDVMEYNYKILNK